MTIASPSSRPVQAEQNSPSPSWGLALTGVIGSGKTTTARALASLLEWRVIASGDIARSIDSGTAQTGKMADPDALDRALLPLLTPGPVILDGYPRTTRQLASLPEGILVVGLNIDPWAALERIAGRDKHGWDERSRMTEQAGSIRTVMRYAAVTINVQGKTPGEVVFDILSSRYLGPPMRR